MTVNLRTSGATAALLTLTLCAACSRGGSSSVGGIGLPDPDVFGPAANVRFPGTRSTTDKNTITVTGHAFDPAGIDTLSVNGVIAITHNRYDSWTATVSLTPGENQLSISTTDLLGNVTEIPVAGTVEYVGPYLARSREILLPGLGSEALVIDSDIDALIGVDLVTGHRRTISAEGVGTGISFVRPVALDIYAAGTRALIVDQGTNSVIDVDLLTGDRSERLLGSDLTIGAYTSSNSIVIDEAGERAFITIPNTGLTVGVHEVSLVTGVGVPFSTNMPGVPLDLMKPTDLDLDANNSRLFLIDEVADTLFSIDMTTGDRTTISSPMVGEGPVFALPRSPRYDSAQDLVYLLDSDREALLAVDLTTGDRSIVSDETHGTGPALASATAVELDTAMSRALVTLDDAVIAVDLVTGERTLLSGNDLGFGPRLSSPTNAFGHLRENAIIVQGTDPDSFPAGFTLYRVDVSTGNRDVTATSDSGTGVEVLQQLSFECNRTLTQAVALGRVLISGEVKLAVYTINLGNSNRTLNYVFPNAPIALQNGDVELDGSNSMAFVGFEDQIWRVLLNEGTAELLSGPGLGTGPALLEVRRIVLDLAANRLLVTDLGRNSVLRVRLDNGHRSEVTGTKVGSGPLSGGIKAIDIDPRGRRVVFTDDVSNSVYISNINDGKRSFLFDGEATNSLFPNDTPNDVVLDIKNNVAYVIFEGALDALMKIELTTRERVLVSR